MYYDYDQAMKNQKDDYYKALKNQIDNRDNIRRNKHTQETTADKNLRISWEKAQYEADQDAMMKSNLKQDEARRYPNPIYLFL